MAAVALFPRDRYPVLGGAGGRWVAPSVRRAHMAGVHDEYIAEPGEIGDRPRIKLGAQLGSNGSHQTHRRAGPEPMNCFCRSSGRVARGLREGVLTCRSGPRMKPAADKSCRIVKLPDPLKGSCSAEWLQSPQTLFAASHVFAASHMS